MSKALESGKAFIESVLAKLPESVRDQARAAFTAPEAADALTVVGDGVLARSDYSKSMDDLKAKEQQLVEDYTRLNTWYDGAKDRLAKVETLEEQIARLSGQQPPTPPADPIRHPAKEEPVSGLTKEEFAAAMEERDRAYAGVMALSNRLTAQHLRDFNEVLDTDALIAYARAKSVDLKTAYDQVHAEKIAAKAQQSKDAEIAKLRQEIEAQVRKEVGQPYPIRNAAPSVLDILDTKTDSPANHTVDTAVAEYERLQAARG